MGDLTSSFLAAIIETPNDDFPRLAFADYLDDAADARGEPLPCPRADLIRVQCELAALPETGGFLLRHIQAATLEMRGRELLEAFAPGLPRECNRWRWLEPLRHILGAWDPSRECDATLFRRGFVESVTLDAHTWIAHADALRLATPLCEVRLTTWPVFYSCGAGYDDDYIVTVREGGQEHILPGMGGYSSRIVVAALTAEWPGITFHLPHN